ILIRQFKIEAAQTEVADEINEEFAPAPLTSEGETPWTATAKDAVNGELIDTGDLLTLEVGDVEVRQPITGIRRTRGGIVWITTDDGEEYRFKPSDEVVWVKAA